MVNILLVNLERQSIRDKQAMHSLPAEDPAHPCGFSVGVQKIMLLTISECSPPCLLHF